MAANDTHVSSVSVVKTIRIEGTIYRFEKALCCTRKHYVLSTCRKNMGVQSTCLQVFCCCCVVCFCLCPKLDLKLPHGRDSVALARGGAEGGEAVVVHTIVLPLPLDAWWVNVKGEVRLVFFTIYSNFVHSAYIVLPCESVQFFF